jgi:hypothetical protein
MVADYFKIYETVDPKLKDHKWMDTCVSLIRQSWRQLVDPVRMAHNKQILFSMQSMENVKKSFKDKQFLENNEILPLPIWNRIINILIEEMVKNPPKAELVPEDAAAISEQQQDIFRLKNRKILENDINNVRRKLGMVGYNMPYEDFNGNIKDFDKLGLDDKDPDDVNFFEGVYHRLLSTIAGQSLVNNIMKRNRFDKEITRRIVIDILAALVCCVQCYVDKVTGAIKYKYIYPETAFLIQGDSEDGSDDVAKGWEDSITIREFLGLVGNEFSWERDWEKLLWALNFSNSYKYTGFIRNNMNFTVYGDANRMERAGVKNATEPNDIDWNLAYNFKVYVGYVEFSTMEVTGTYLAKEGTGEVLPTPLTFGDDKNDKKDELKGYFKESFYQEQIYTSYYLSTGTVSQYTFNWGKLLYQQLDGAFDEYAKGSLMYLRYEGKPAAELSKPYIDFANTAFYRMKWAVYHSKPKREQFFIPEMIKLAKQMQRMGPENAGKALPTFDNVLTQIIKYKNENFIDLRDFPEVDGKPHPVLPQQEVKSDGVDPLVLGLQAVTVWCEQQIAQAVGLNDLRLGQINNPRQGYKQGVEETQSSYNSTGYIYRMVQTTKEHIAQYTLNYAQDIIRFKDTAPYKWLLRLMGDEQFENLRLLGDFSTHRYGIYIDDISTAQLKNEIKQVLQAVLLNPNDKAAMSPSQWGVVRMELENDPKRALQLLTFLQMKDEKKRRKQEIQMEQMRQKHQKEMQDAEIKANQEHDQQEIKKVDIPARASVEVAKINNETKKEVKQMGIENDPTKQQTRAEQQKEVASHKADLEQQKSY